VHFSSAVLKKISAWSTFTIVCLCSAFGSTLIGLLKKEDWAKDPWLAPVIIAITWSIFQKQK
jgi:cbb3-type cytochrome oxidase subunit 1